MPEIRANGALTDNERRLAQALDDAIVSFNLETTGIRDFSELLIAETDDDGAIGAGVSGWSWGGTCWIESLWVRGDRRGHEVGTTDRRRAGSATAPMSPDRAQHAQLPGPRVLRAPRLRHRRSATGLPGRSHRVAAAQAYRPVNAPSSDRRSRPVRAAVLSTYS